MKAYLFLFALIIIAAGGYGYSQNPDACRKLGTDFVRDVKAIYVGSPNSTEPLTTDTAPLVALASPAPASASVSPGQPVATVQPGAPIQPTTAIQPGAPVQSTTAVQPAATEGVAPAIDPEIPADMRAWDTEDYALGVRAAKQQHKRLFLFFTGSDYCPPCKMTVRDVFPTAEFQNWAAANFVIVTVDFPHEKSHQSAALQAQNNSLHEKYRIQGVPTFIITETDGTEVKRLLGGVPTAGQLISYMESKTPGSVPPGTLIPPDTHL